MNNDRPVFYLMLLFITLYTAEMRSMFGFGKQLNDTSRESGAHFNKLYGDHLFETEKKSYILNFLKSQNNVINVDFEVLHSKKCFKEKKVWNELDIIDESVPFNKELQFVDCKPLPLRRILEEYNFLLLPETVGKIKQGKKLKKWNGVVSYNRYKYDK